MYRPEGWSARWKEISLRDEINGRIYGMLQEKGGRAKHNAATLTALAFDQGGWNVGQRIGVTSGRVCVSRRRRASIVFGALSLEQAEIRSPVGVNGTCCVAGVHARSKNALWELVGIKDGA